MKKLTITIIGYYREFNENDLITYLNDYVNRKMILNYSMDIEKFYISIEIEFIKNVFISSTFIDKLRDITKSEDLYISEKNMGF